MANPEHLAILRQGVKIWNQWRIGNPGIKPDLKNVNLANANLANANLAYTDLEKTNFTKANLYRADLANAYLFKTILTSSNLSETRLENARFYRANLDSANLLNSNLIGTKFNDANLSNAKFDRAILSNSVLKNAKLESANFEKASLDQANLKNANFKGSILRNTYLYDADLSDTIFLDSELENSDFTRVKALGTNFGGANLTGICIEDWNINSQTNLKDVNCDYIYLKRIYSEEENKWIFTDRIPRDPDKIFAPGEFTKRYQKILETVDLYFGEGIDWQVFLKSFQKLQAEEKIKINNGAHEIPIVQGIENTGDGSFVIKVGVSPNTDKGTLEKSFWQKYQKQLEETEERYRSQLNFKDEQIEFYRQNYTQVLDIIKLTASQPINITQQQGANNMSEKREIKIENGNYNQEIKGDYYQQSGNIGIGHMSGGTISGNAKVAGVINEADQQDLTAAAAEIQKLLNQLAQTNPTETLPEQMVVGAKAIRQSLALRDRRN